MSESPSGGGANLPQPSNDVDGRGQSAPQVTAEHYFPFATGQDDAADVAVDDASVVASPRGATRRRHHRRNVAIGLVIAFVVVGSVTGVVTSKWSHIKSLFGNSNPAADPCPTSPAASGSVVISVNTGDTGDIIAQTLCKAGAIQTKQDFINALNLNPQANSIQPGTYKIPVPSTASGVIAALLNPADRQAGIVVPEGFRAEQIFLRIATSLHVSVDDVATAAKNTAAIGLPAEANGMVEGWLYPATYPVTPSSTPTSILKSMVSQTVQQLQSLSVPQGQWHATIVAASIVEKEAKVDSDRPIMAGVINNRLAISMPIQSDVTVLYGAGDFTRSSPTSAELSAQNGYNTYVNKGLPVGAIDSPGLASIKAVVNPTKSQYLYWCTINLDTGQTVFSVTLAEHEQAVAQLHAWLAANPGKG